MQTSLELLCVGAGGLIGSVLRYLIYLFSKSNFESSFPIGTFAVNIAGCFLIGYFSIRFETTLTSSPIRLFLTTGLVGGFTTFSAFGLETILLMRDGKTGLAALYVGASLMLGFGAVLLGRVVG